MQIRQQVVIKAIWHQCALCTSGGILHPGVSVSAEKIDKWAPLMSELYISSATCGICHFGNSVSNSRERLTLSLHLPMTGSVRVYTSVGLIFTLLQDNMCPDGSYPAPVLKQQRSGHIQTNPSIAKKKKQKKTSLFLKGRLGNMGE